MPNRNRVTHMGRESIVKCVLNSVLKDNKLSFCTLNSQSIKNKMDEFRLIFEGSKATVVSVSETWANSHVSDALIKLNGYNLIRHDSRGKRGGGLAIYIHDNIKFKVIEKSDSSSKTEFVIFEILLNGTKILVISIYNPPKIDCLGILEEKLSKYSLNYDDVIVTGDLNIDFMPNNKRNSKMTLLLKNMFDTFGLKNLVSSPTHFTNGSATALDYMACTNYNRLLAFNQIDIPEFSKHDLIFCSLDYDLVFENPTVKRYRNYSRFDINFLVSEVQKLCWHNYFCLVDSNDISIYLYNNLNRLHDTVFPEKSCSKTKSSSPWFNQQIRLAMIDRDCAYKHWKITKNQSDFNTFKFLRNRVRTIVRDTRQE